MLHLVSYDVTCDARRHRVSEILKDYGRRVQYSVFECELDDAAWKELLERLDFAVDADSDSCRIYRLCAACSAEVRIIGKGDRYQQPGFVIV